MVGFWALFQPKRIRQQTIAQKKSTSIVQLTSNLHRDQNQNPKELNATLRSCNGRFSLLRSSTFLLLALHVLPQGCKQLSGLIRSGRLVAGSVVGGSFEKPTNCLFRLSIGRGAFWRHSRLRSRFLKVCLVPP